MARRAHHTHHTQVAQAEGGGHRLVQFVGAIAQAGPYKSAAMAATVVEWWVYLVYKVMPHARGMLLAA